MLISSLLICPSSSQADQATQVTKGQPAPYTGFLIDQEKAQKVYNLSIDLSAAQKTNTLLTEETDILNKRVANAQGEVDSLARELAVERDKSIFTKAGYFILGAAITGLISYGVVRTLK